MSRRQPALFIGLGFLVFLTCSASSAAGAGKEQLTPENHLAFAIGVPKEIFKILSGRILGDKDLGDTCGPVLNEIKNEKIKSKFIPAPFIKGQTTRNMINKYSVLSVECTKEASSATFSSIGNIVIDIGSKMTDTPIPVYLTYAYSPCQPNQCCLRRCEQDYRKSRTRCGPLC